MISLDLYEPYLSHWDLIPDGAPIKTHSSLLLPVLYQSNAAMLKISHSSEERMGSALMVWWNGHGAAPVFKQEEDALLMVRAENNKSLLEQSDDDASRIICSVAETLHHYKSNDPPSVNLVSLPVWFQSLARASSAQGGLFSQSYEIAQKLLNTSQDVVVLHGDLHHGNVLDFGKLGWLAIDPKHITGERGYDYANIFCNPNEKVALAPHRLAKQVKRVAEAAGLERYRLLQWIVAYGGLSAAWSLEDGQDPQLAMEVAKLGLFELGL